MIKKSILLLILIFILIFNFIFLKKEKIESIDNIRKSIVLIKVEYSINKKLFLTNAGTGVVVFNNESGSFILTAAHIYKQDNLLSTFFDIGIYVKEENNNHEAKILHINMVSDLMLLYIPNKIQNLSFYERKPNLGQKLINLGFPQGGKFGIIYAEGLLSSEDYHCSLMKLSGLCYMTNIDVGAGSSGSPILTENGKILGIVLAYTSAKPYLSIFIGIDSIRGFFYEAKEALENVK